MECHTIILVVYDSYSTSNVMSSLTQTILASHRQQFLVAVLDSLLSYSQKRALRNSPAKHTPPNNLVVQAFKLQASSLKSWRMDGVRPEPPDDLGKNEQSRTTGLVSTLIPFILWRLA